MSSRSPQRSPGPPPSSPPPPTPSLTSANLTYDPRTPLPRQSREKPPPEQPPRKHRARQPTQWPASPNSQGAKDAAVWPAKAPPKPKAAPTPYASPAPKPEGTAPLRRNTVSTPSADTAARRSSLSSLSLNRFSFHRARPKQLEELPPSPATKPVWNSSATPSTNNNVSGRIHENKATTSGSHAVQRRVSGVERRVSGARNHGSTTSRTPPRTPTVVTHPVDDAIQLNSHVGTPSQAPAPTLKKKRSFFKRVADKLTGSRGSLRDDYKARRASIHSAVSEMPPIPHQHAVPHNDAPAPEKIDHPSQSTLTPAKNDPSPGSALPPTPTSTRARKNRQPPLSIKIHTSEKSRDHMFGVASPTGGVLPQSPRPEAILAAMSRQTASLRQPPSPATSTRQPSPTSSTLRQLPSPVTSTWHPLSPVPSTQSPVSPTRQPPSLVTMRDTTTRRPTLSIPRQPSPVPSAATGASSATPAHLPSPSTLHFPLPPQGHSPKRTDARGGHDGDREREWDQSWERGCDGAPSPQSGGCLPGTVEDEADEDEEEERRQSEAKVSQWLTIPESPTTSSSLDHSVSLSHSQSSHSHSANGRVVSGKRFSGGFRGIDEESGNGSGGEGMDMWRGAVMVDRDGEEDLLPEVERMALEAEERVRARGGELANENMIVKSGRKEGNLKKAGRQLSLFGKRKGKREDSMAADTYPRARARAATTTDRETASRRSLSFLSSIPASPTTSVSPTIPVPPVMTLVPPTSGVPVATPRLRKPTTNPTMHTRGSILLEAKEIQDPEVRRLSEMVFLS